MTQETTRRERPVGASLDLLHRADEGGVRDHRAKSYRMLRGVGASIEGARRSREAPSMTERRIDEGGGSIVVGKTGGKANDIDGIVDIVLILVHVLAEMTRRYTIIITTTTITRRKTMTQ